MLRGVLSKTFGPFLDLALGGVLWATVISTFFFTWLRLKGFLEAASTQGKPVGVPPIVPLLAAFVASALVYHFLQAIFSKVRGESDPHIRGTKLLSFEQARAKAGKLHARPDTLRPIFWGGLALPNRIAPAGFLAVGDPGYGKTVSIDLLLKSALVSPGSDAKAVVFDPKTDTFCRLKNMGVRENRIVLLNPFDVRGHSWDLGRDLTRAEFFPEVALSLFPDEESQNPFFEKAARDLLEGVLLSFYHGWPLKSRSWTLRDVILALGHRPWLVRVLSWYPAANTRRIEQYFSDARTANNIMSSISTKTSSYAVIASYWHHAEMAQQTVSLEAWKDTDTILVLPHSHRAKEALAAINGVMFRRLAQVILDLPASSSRRVWVVVDELTKAGELPMLDDLVVKGRDRGVCVVAGFQSIEGLREVYGENIAGEISNVLGHKAFFGIKGDETARWAQDTFGRAELWQSTSTRGQSGTQGSWSVNTAPVEKPIVLASQFQAIERPDVTGKIDGFYFTSGVGPYQHAIRLKDVGRTLSPITDNDARENFQERPTEQGFLRSWDEKELAALRLPPLETRGHHKNRPPSPPDEPLNYT